MLAERKSEGHLLVEAAKPKVHYVMSGNSFLHFYSSFQVHSSFQRPINPAAPFPCSFPIQRFLWCGHTASTQLFSWQNWGTSLSGRTVLVNPGTPVPEGFNFLFRHWESNQWPLAWCCHTVPLELRVHIDGALCCPIGVLLKACSDSWTRLSLRMSITHMLHHLFLTIETIATTKECPNAELLAVRL